MAASASSGARRGLLPAFEFDLKTPVQQGRVTIGKCEFQGLWAAGRACVRRVAGAVDGSHPSLACSTPGGKVFLHSPHNTAGASASRTLAASAIHADELSGGGHLAPHVRFLNINRQVTAISAGQVPIRRRGGAEEDSAKGRDVLFVGTASSCLAYDVDSNADLFSVDAPDGVSAVLVDELPGLSPASAEEPGKLDPVVVAGGNCSILAFDPSGNEVAWLVTGDQVTCMTTGVALAGGTPASLKATGEKDLVVASEDLELRVFRGEDVALEATETGRVTGMDRVAPGAFAYSLENGTIGVYRGGKREWRVKAKGSATACLAFDLDADGDPEVLSGWSSGKLEARRSDNGALVYRETAAAGASAVAGVVSADYRMGGGDPQAVVVSTDGLVKGFLPVEAEVASAATGGGTLMDSKGADDRALEELQSLKKDMELKLQALQRGTDSIKAGEISSSAIPAGAAVAISPRIVGTPIALIKAGKAPPSAHPPRLEVLVVPSSRVALKYAVAMSLDVKLFHGESFVAAPEPSPATKVIPPGSLSIPILPSANAPVSLTVSALVGARLTADRFLSLTDKVVLPEFAAWRRVRPAELGLIRDQLPAGGVEFPIPDRPERVALWMDAAFLSSEGPYAVDPATGMLRYVMVSLRPPKSSILDSAAASVSRKGDSFDASTLCSARLSSSNALALSAAVQEAAAAGGGLTGAVADTADVLADIPDGVSTSPSTLAAGGTMLVVEAVPSPDKHGYLVRILCDSMSDAADVVQSLGGFLGVSELNPRVAFPAEMATLSKVLNVVQEANAMRVSLSTDLAEGTHRVKSLIVRAEDSRTLGDIPSMRAAYSRLMAVNGELTAEHRRRSVNHATLLEALRRVNSAIQIAARLRIGKSRTRLVGDCRAALKANNTKGIFAAIQGGS
jgi:Bardet-Biedl syndrome 2 protein